jgi:Flp pilus assembly protein TadG
VSCWGYAMISDFARRLKSGLKRGVGRVSADQRGNVLMLTAAALVPLIGIIGSGIDIGRSYMTQLRLQQACDAGALAGRRAMAGGEFGPDAEAEATRMFNFNFPNGMYGAENVNFTAVHSGGSDVVGAANAVLPTSLMHMFGFESFNLSVNCGAKLEIANTDVMLVLDVTGSMIATTTTNKVSTKKITSLIAAANLFVDELMSADKGDGQLRIGLVPYSNTVNVGHLLKREWIVDEVTLPSQTPTCSKWNTAKTSCTGTWSHKLENKTFTIPAAFKAGDSFNQNTGWRGAEDTGKWDGCIVEAETKVFAVNGSIPSDAYDMNIDHVPTSNQNSKWKPYLPHLVYHRASTSTVNQTSSVNNMLKKALANTGNQSSSYDPNYGRCASPAMKLTVLDQSSKTLIKSRIDALETSKVSPYGLTYMDSGMAWGGRLLSPTGIFGAENSDAPNERAIGRHLIFMTDGKMEVQTSNYSHQGHEPTMRRVAGGGSDLVGRHNYRFLQLCERVKNLKTQRDGRVTIWVIAFGAGADDIDTLKKCSSSSSVYVASDGTKLAQVFQAIAGQISRLRVSQ